MKKVYEAKKNFWIGEINKELKAGMKVDFDDVENVLVLNGQSFEVKNLKAAIKAEWLVPADGIFPELNGPVGETQIQEGERKRKERFAAMAKENRPEIVKDEQVVGCIDEERAPMSFAHALGLDPEPPKKGKFMPIVIEDDTKVVKKINLENKEVKEIKKALNQDKKDKKGIKKFEVFTDHYDAEAVEIVGKYNDNSKEQVLTTWASLHWTKKADVIKEAESKEFLTKLRGLESSTKMIERINTRILTLD